MTIEDLRTAYLRTAGGDENRERIRQRIMSALTDLGYIPPSDLALLLKHLEALS